MENKSIFSCYLVQKYPVGHRVILVFPDENLENKMIEGEESLFYVYFFEDDFNGKIMLIVDYLSKDDVRIFFSELIYIGFREGRLKYDKFTSSDIVQTSISYHPENPEFNEIFSQLKIVLKTKELRDVCLGTIVYGLQSLFHLTHQEIFGFALN